MEDYEKMLELGIEQLPESTKKKERFEIPKAKGHVEGNKTIITNFNQIVDDFHCEAAHLLKFILKELATPGNIQDNRLVLGRKISSSEVNEQIERYAKLYVLCYECGKPDTKLSKDNGILTMKCTACGAKHPVRA